MDRLMAFSTHHKRFASSCNHLLDPFRFLFSSRLLEIREFANMVDLYFFFRSAEFTHVSENALEQFAPVSHRKLGLMINKDRVLLSFERDTAELGNEWLPVAAPLNHDFETLSQAMGRLCCRFVLTYHCCNRGFVLPCQGFEHGRFCYPLEFTEPADIVGQQVVLDNSSIFGLIFTDTAVVTVMLHFSPLCWLAFAHILGAFVFNDFFGHS